MFDERGASKTHEALCLLVHMCSACSLQTRRFGFVAEKGEESISVKSLMKRNTWRWGSNRMDICIYIYTYDRGTFRYHFALHKIPAYIYIY